MEAKMLVEGNAIVNQEIHPIYRAHNCNWLKQPLEKLFVPNGDWTDIVSWAQRNTTQISQIKNAYLDERICGFLVGSWLTIETCNFTELKGKYFLHTETWKILLWQEERDKLNQPQVAYKDSSGEPTLFTYKYPDSVAYAPEEENPFKM